MMHYWMSQLEAAAKPTATSDKLSVTRKPAQRQRPLAYASRH
jgi:hypothetical protein